jgi:hypothetical protein
VVSRVSFRIIINNRARWFLNHPNHYFVKILKTVLVGTRLTEATMFAQARRVSDQERNVQSHAQFAVVTDEAVGNSEYDALEFSLRLLLCVLER